MFKSYRIVVISLLSFMGAALASSAESSSKSHVIKLRSKPVTTLDVSLNRDLNKVFAERVRKKRFQQPLSQLQQLLVEAEPVFFQPLNLDEYWKSRGGEGDWVGNAGVAENNFQFAFANMEHYLRLCLSSSACELNDWERGVVEKIILAMPFERRNRQALIFDKRKEYFWDGQQYAIARTGDYVGSPIYINQDLLYRKVDGRVRIFGIRQAFAVLVHELGHHQREYDHQLLDQLGSKVSRVLAGGVDRDLFGKANQLASIVINPNKDYVSRPPSTRLVYYDGQSRFELSQQLLDSLRCPREWGGQSPSRVLVRRAPSWWWGAGVSPHVLGRADLVCQIGDREHWFRDSRFKIHFQFRIDAKGLRRLIRNGFQITQCIGPADC